MAKIWKLTKCPSLGEQIKKRWYISRYIYYIAILLNHKKELKRAICNNMDGSTLLSEIRQTEKDEDCMISFVCESKEQIDNHAKHKQSYRYKEQTSGRQKGRRWRRIKIHKGD